MSDPTPPAVSEAMREAVARGLLIAREMIAEKYGVWSPERGHIFSGREVDAVQAIDAAVDLVSEIARRTGERDAAACPGQRCTTAKERERKHLQHVERLQTALRASDAALSRLQADRLLDAVEHNGMPEMRHG